MYSNSRSLATRICRHSGQHACDTYQMGDLFFQIRALQLDKANFWYANSFDQIRPGNILGFETGRN